MSLNKQENANFAPVSHQVLYFNLSFKAGFYDFWYSSTWVRARADMYPQEHISPGTEISEWARCWLKMDSASPFQIGTEEPLEAMV